MISDEVTEFELTPHETSIKYYMKLENIKIALRIDNKTSPLSSSSFSSSPSLSSSLSSSSSSRGNELSSNHSIDFPKIGYARVTTWQGKNIASSYPVYLEINTNLMSSRRYASIITILLLLLS